VLPKKLRSGKIDFGDLFRCFEEPTRSRFTSYFSEIFENTPSIVAVLISHVSKEEDGKRISKERRRPHGRALRQLDQERIPLFAGERHPFVQNSNDAIPA
jgi:hypothetical protein